MTDQTTPAAAGGEAQPIADANSVDGIINNAVTENTPEKPATEPAEQNKPEVEAEEIWPKKAENALAKAKGRAAQLKAERDQERNARQRLEQQLAQYTSPQPKAAKTGEPSEKDFTNYADYLEARSEWKIDQKLAEQSGKQQQSNQAAQEQAYFDNLYKQTQAKSDEFISQVPDAQSVFEENADVIEACPDNIYRLFLESGDAPLAAYNLAKQGKLEAIISMSPAKAAIEIGRALAQAPSKPQTKAPTPLPAARGSVPSGKSLDAMSGDELLKWVNSKG